MQDMQLQAGSALLIFFPVAEGFQIITCRPLSAEEKSLTIKFASNVGGNSAANIGMLVD